MDKKIIIGILVIGTVLAANATVVLGAKVSMDNYRIEKGHNITIPVLASGVTNLAGTAVEVSFNPEVVQALNVSEVGMTVAAYNINNTEGWIKMAVYDLYGKSGDVIIANITFTGIREETTHLGIRLIDSLFDVNYSDIPCEIKNGSITVLDAGKEEICTLNFTYGWNAISAPVRNNTIMATLFVTKVPGFFAVYSWNNTAQKWVTEDLWQPLDPSKGYFIWSNGDAKVELIGEPANYSPDFKRGWNLVGPGFSVVKLDDNFAWEYNYAYGYKPTRTLKPSKGYFIFIGGDA